MKEKIGILVLIVILAGLLILSNTFLTKQQNAMLGNLVNSNSSIKNETYVDNNEVSLNEKNNNEEDKKVSENVLEITSENFEKEVLESDKKVLVDFYAEWCGPCKMLSPIVEEVAGEEKDIKFVKLNIDNAEDIATDYQVMSIPTLVAIENGKEVNRSVGLISKQEILNLIK